MRLNSHHRLRYSKELREFLTGEKLDKMTVDHLAGYTKQLRSQFEKLKSNKIYTNIMTFAQAHNALSEPVPANLEAEY